MIPVNPSEMAQVLLDAGYTDGWAISGETLVLWEHDEAPPAPLVRPDAPSPDPAGDPS